MGGPCYFWRRGLASRGPCVDVASLNCRALNGVRYKFQNPSYPCTRLSTGSAGSTMFSCSLQPCPVDPAVGDLVFPMSAPPMGLSCTERKISSTPAAQAGNDSVSGQSNPARIIIRRFFCADPHPGRGFSGWVTGQCPPSVGTGWRHGDSQERAGTWAAARRFRNGGGSCQSDRWMYTDS